eukprot:TRINITY_DN51776_c0_g1_i1.p1 TRINITY_DN51776_c0_g1~~TRINITY_DN51776_c0_g1_i1.p1  ORF type:complete len:321 (+),score=78.50 TRINITY_DN51776_c0_g1_i1:82-963(+)
MALAADTEGSGGGGELSPTARPRSPSSLSPVRSMRAPPPPAVGPDELRTTEELARVCEQHPRRLIVLEFFTPDAVCRDMEDTVLSLRGEFAQTVWRRVPCAAAPLLCGKYAVRCAPTYVLLVGGMTSEVVEGADPQALAAAVGRRANTWSVHCLRNSEFMRRCPQMSLAELLREQEEFYNPQQDARGGSSDSGTVLDDDDRRAQTGPRRDEVQLFPLLRRGDLDPARSQSADAALARHQLLRNQFSAVTTRLRYPPPPPNGPGPRGGPRPRIVDPQRRKLDQQRKDQLIWVWA